VDAVRLVDKPPGVTSHDVVASVRRSLPRGTKVGHAGTLDPFATGLLLVLIGRATRVQRVLMALEKEYVTSARFGWTSSTGDPEGELVETGRVPSEPLELPTGELRQRPPVFSAVKIGGERAYARARRGEQFEVPERTVHVYEFSRLAPQEFRIRCSAGTYVRSLIADLGDAYCTALRRTRIGPFALSETPLELSLGDALSRFLPVVRLDGEDARRASHGVAVHTSAQLPGTPVSVPGTDTEVPRTHTEVVLLCDGDGPIALAEPREGGELKPVVGFRA